MARLAGKVALVTGAARGLGAAMCRAMAAEGAAILATDLRDDEGADLVAELKAAGTKAAYAHQDATIEDRWDEVVALAQSELGGLDIVVNNAGIVVIDNIEEATFENWRRTMAINLDAVFLGTRAGVRAMKGRGGSIINISSIEGIVGNQFIPAYNASKGGVRLLTKSAARYCAAQNTGIRVNSVHPGYVGTSLVEDAVPHLPDNFADATIARIPMGRFGEPPEIASAVVFLASDESSYMTGAELVVDGGYTS